MSETETYVYLQCVKEFGKLRIKVISPGYLRNANTQFPKDIRMVGRKYKVLAHDIQLIQTRGKYFYSVKKREKIIIMSEGDVEVVSNNNLDLTKIKIHTDEESDECIICMDTEKQIVFDPCGHLYSCVNCSSKVSKCPICRSVIVNRINKEQFG